MTLSFVVEPGCSFAEIGERLAALGFQRDETAPVMPDFIDGEPELAGWTRDETRLVYTFNPAVSLRVLSADREVELSGLPLLDVARAGELLSDEEPHAVLLGILAARALGARSLAPAIGILRAHDVEIIRQAADSTLEALLERKDAEGEAEARAESLFILDRLCDEARPLLRALVGPDGPAVAEKFRSAASQRSGPTS